MAARICFGSDGQALAMRFTLGGNDRMLASASVKLALGIGSMS
ncbi:MAG: hypothetical protein R3E01_05685 [Pirellulaceae bacterium]